MLSLLLMSYRLVLIVTGVAGLSLIVTDVGELEMRELQSWCITLHLLIVTDVGELRELQNRGASLYTC